MRKPVLASTLAVVALLIGSAAADAASFSGTWTSKYNAMTTLELKLKPSGANYTGTYSTITTLVIKKKKTTKTVSMPLAARAVTVQNVPTLIVTITVTQPPQPTGAGSKTSKTSTAKKPTVTFFCTLKSQKLSCQSTVAHKNIVFSPSK